MRVLITGGAGFIGSHAATLLTEKGASVCVFDSLVSGKRERVPARANFIQGDIRDRAALDAAMKGVTHVVHLAALVSVPESVRHPAETFAVNVEGTQNVFAAAHAAGVRQVVYASSAAVYGDAPELPKREDMALAPQSPYAESKVQNESDAVRMAAKGFSLMGLRFFNVYGPGQSADHAYASVVPRFIKEARAGQPLPLTGDGSQTRDFIHVSDVARAIAAALESDANGVCNIASGDATRISELIDLIRAAYPVEVQVLPPRPGDILHSVADISRAKEVLHWSPTVSFPDGIRELLSV